MIKDCGQDAKTIATIKDEKMTTTEMQKKYRVQGFCAPFVVVSRIEDGKKGTLEFGHNPRVYFNWVGEND